MGVEVAVRVRWVMMVMGESGNGDAVDVGASLSYPGFEMRNTQVSDKSEMVITLDRFIAKAWCLSFEMERCELEI